MRLAKVFLKSWSCFRSSPCGLEESSSLVSPPDVLYATITMDKIGKRNVVHKLQKRKLLIAINCLAGLSIFFFGYDQG